MKSVLKVNLLKRQHNLCASGKHLGKSLFHFEYSKICFKMLKMPQACLSWSAKHRNNKGVIYFWAQSNIVSRNSATAEHDKKKYFIYILTFLIKAFTNKNVEKFVFYI